jgi:small neutral amino acid transporter SnatA (MarC family)
MLEKIIRDFMTIWTTIDPISNLALFAGLTAAMHRAERRKIAGEHLSTPLSSWSLPS